MSIFLLNQDSQIKYSLVGTHLIYHKGDQLFTSNLNEVLQTQQPLVNTEVQDSIELDEPGLGNTPYPTGVIHEEAKFLSDGEIVTVPRKGVFRIDADGQMRRIHLPPLARGDFGSHNLQGLLLIIHPLSTTPSAMIDLRFQIYDKQGQLLHSYERSTFTKPDAKAEIWDNTLYHNAFLDLYGLMMQFSPIDFTQFNGQFYDITASIHKVTTNPNIAIWRQVLSRNNLELFRYEIEMDLVNGTKTFKNTMLPELQERLTALQIKHQIVSSSYRFLLVNFSSSGRYVIVNGWNIIDVRHNLFVVLDLSTMSWQDPLIGYGYITVTRDDKLLLTHVDANRDYSFDYLIRYNISTAEIETQMNNIRTDNHIPIVNSYLDRGLSNFNSRYAIIRADLSRYLLDFDTADIYLWSSPEEYQITDQGLIVGKNSVSYIGQPSFWNDRTIRYFHPNVYPQFFERLAATEQSLAQGRSYMPPEVQSLVLTQFIQDATRDAIKLQKIN